MNINNNGWTAWEKYNSNSDIQHGFVTLTLEAGVMSEKTVIFPVAYPNATDLIVILNINQWIDISVNNIRYAVRSISANEFVVRAYCEKALTVTFGWISYK